MNSFTGEKHRKRVKRSGLGLRGRRSHQNSLGFNPKTYATRTFFKRIKKMGTGEGGETHAILKKATSLRATPAHTEERLRIQGSKKGRYGKGTQMRKRHGR